MPSHIRFLLRNACIGALAGISFSALLIGLDVAGLRHLVLDTPDGPLAAIIMTVLFVITFGSVQMGRAVMALADTDAAGPPDRPDGGELVLVRLERGK